MEQISLYILSFKLYTDGFITFSTFSIFGTDYSHNNRPCDQPICSTSRFHIIVIGVYINSLLPPTFTNTYTHTNPMNRHYNTFAARQPRYSFWVAGLLRIASSIYALSAITRSVIIPMCEYWNDDESEWNHNEYNTYEGECTPTRIKSHTDNIAYKMLFDTFITIVMPLCAKKMADRIAETIVRLVNRTTITGMIIAESANIYIQYVSPLPNPVMEILQPPTHSYQQQQRQQVVRHQYYYPMDGILMTRIMANRDAGFGTETDDDTNGNGNGTNIAPHINIRIDADIVTNAYKLFGSGSNEPIITSCPICIEHIDKDNAAVCNPCLHIFCYTCIDGYSQSIYANTSRYRNRVFIGPECPLCRTSVQEVYMTEPNTCTTRTICNTNTPLVVPLDEEL